jgi:hypothetical protein
LSLDVPTALLHRAEAGTVTDEEFVACVRDSLPRGGLERHFGLKPAFQNCHRVAAFRPTAIDGDAYRDFVSPAGQLRNQSPELRDC